MEQVSISGGNGQTPSDHNGTSNLLNRLNLPTSPRGTMVKVTGNGVPGAVGQGRCALLSGFEVPWVNGTGQTASVSAVGRRENLTTVVA